MQIRFILAVLLLFSLSAKAQVGIGTPTPAASSILEISSTTKGVLFPRMTAAERAGIASPDTGLVVFQKNATAGLYFYDGKQWLNLTTGTKPDAAGYALAASAYGSVTTVAGTGATGSFDTAALYATFNNLYSIATNGSGYWYIADPGAHVIRQLSPDGQVSTFAGSGTTGTADGTGTAASFTYPYGVAVDKSGNVYVSDRDANNVRKISPAGVVTTLAFTFGGPPTSTTSPLGIAVDGSGNLYLNARIGVLISRIFKTTTSGGALSVMAGNTASGSADGTGAAATFNGPNGLAVDANGNVYVADELNHKIRMVTPAGVVTTLAGSGTAGAANGAGAAASFNGPKSVAVDAYGYVYVTDFGNNLIRRISPGGMVYTLAGSGSAGAADGYGNSASFSSPFGICVDGNGVLLVTDRGNKKIRRVGL